MKGKRIIDDGLPAAGAGALRSLRRATCGKDGNTVHRLLGFAVLAVACVVGLSSVGCTKKDTTKRSSAGPTSTHTQETSADSKKTEVRESTSVNTSRATERAPVVTERTPVTERAPATVK